jgi:hypothetical protein
MKIAALVIISLVLASSARAQSIEIAASYDQPKIERVYAANGHWLADGLRFPSERKAVDGRICFGAWCANALWSDTELDSPQQFLRGARSTGTTTGWIQGFQVGGEYRFTHWLAFGAGYRRLEFEYETQDQLPIVHIPTNTRFHHRWQGPVAQVRTGGWFDHLYAEARIDWSPKLWEEQTYDFETRLSSGTHKSRKTHSNAKGVEFRVGWDVWKGLTPFIATSRSWLYTGSNPALVINSSGPTELRSPWTLTIGASLRHMF